MPTEKSYNGKKLGKNRLQRIIEMMKEIETRNVDPFLLNINEIIKIIQEFFPQWDEPEEFNLDSEAIHHLASVIKIQSEWVKKRSTSLYTDPFLLEEKISIKTKDQFAKIFLNSWHPIIEQERLTLNSFLGGLKYWNELLPMKDRWPEFFSPEIKTQTTTKNELINQDILREEEFSAELERFWQNLKKEVDKKGDNGKILYMEFVGAESYSETVHKAYLTSFLITYGYATLEVIPLEEEIYIIPLREHSPISNKQAVSLPITLTHEKWLEWKKSEKND